MEIKSLPKTGAQLVVVGFEDESQKVPASAAEGTLGASSEAILALTLVRDGGCEDVGV